MTPYFLRALNAHTAQSQFRPPSPPAYLSDRFNTDLAEVRDIARGRTQTQTDIANFWNLSAGTVGTLGYWDERAALFIVERGLDDEDASHLFALMNAAAMDATIGCWEAKYFYLMLRPTMADPTIKLATGLPGFPYTLPNHPSYPSGHSCISSAAVTVLSRYFPAHAAQLNTDLIEAGMSRIYGGIHYRFDIEAGQTLGRSTAEWAIAYDRRRGLLAALGLGEREEEERDRR
jgi:membrane-associated phospholipid phosphatase